MSTTDIFAMRGGVDKQDPSEKARAAVLAFRRMQPTLTSYARVLTGKSDVRVEMSATSNGMTDGKRIFLRPPMALGDNTPHDRSLCDKRDDDLQQLCSACWRREAVLIAIYHEIGHIAHDSFASVTDEDRAGLVANAVKQVDKKFARAVEQKIAKAGPSAFKSYMGMSSLVSPFLPGIFNCIEDARINRQVYLARKGTKIMFEADNYNAFKKGVEQVGPDGNTRVIQWRDYPLNGQMAVGLYAKLSGFDTTEYLVTEVNDALADEQIVKMLRTFPNLRTPGNVYELSIKVLARLRELGFFKSDTDPDVEPEEDTDELADEQQQQDLDDGSDEQDSPEGGESSADDGSEADSGEGGPESLPDDDGDEGGSPVDDQGTDSDGEASSDDDSSNGEEDGDGGTEAGDDSDSSGEGGSPSEEGDDADGGTPSGDEADDSGDGAGSDRGESGGRSSEEGGDPSDDEHEGLDGPSEGAGEADSGASETSGDGSEGSVDEDASGDSSGGSSSEGSGDDSGDEQDESLHEDSGDASAPGRDRSDAEASQDSSSDGDSGMGSPGDDDGSDSSGSDPAGSEPVQPPADLSPGSSGNGSGDLMVPEFDAAGSDENGEANQKEASPDSQSSESSVNPGSREIGDGEDGDVDPIDTGADEGLGGIQLIEDSAFDRLPMGKPEDVESVVHEIGHPEERPDAIKESQDSSGHMERAIIQGMYFETPSRNIFGVREHKYNQPIISGQWNLSAAWDKSWVHAAGYTLKRAGIDGDFDSSEKVLGPALLKMRAVFADNRRGKEIRHRKSGKVNARVLGKRAPLGDERLFMRRILPGKRSYFVLIGIDVSGSTAGVNIVLAKQAAMAQAELCARLGVSFAVYAHSGKEHDPASGRWQGSDLDIYLVKEPDEPWSDPIKERLRALGPDSSNIDGHTMEYYRKVLDRRPETDKILLYYTDGKMPAENYQEELEILQREIKICRKKNYTLLGVGIRTDSPVRHGLNTVQVNNGEEIIKVVEHLERALLTNDNVR